MPYDDAEEMKKRDNARRGLDEYGKPIVRPGPPAKAAPPPPVKFTKPFTNEERAKQAEALQRALRKHEKEEDY